MKLYGYWRSTATWRVRIALAHKGIAYEYVPVHLVRDGGEQNRPGFLALNPMRHVPVLVVDDDDPTHRIAESLAILEFLEERFPARPLLPKDAFLRARARQLALLSVSGIQPLQNTKVQKWLKHELHVDERAWCAHWVSRGLEALELLTRETSGEYSVGDALGFPDVCLVPQLHFARRFGIDLAPFPTLSRIDATCAALPEFQSAHADRQPDSGT